MKLIGKKQDAKVYLNGQRLLQGTRISKKPNGDFTAKFGKNFLGVKIKLRKGLEINKGNAIQVELGHPWYNTFVLEVEKDGERLIELL